MLTDVNIKYGLSLIVLCLCIHNTEAQCNTTNRFGTDCQFKCHCMNKTHCDSVTGDCPLGCDFEWVGPACQRRNIVLSATAITTHHSSNIRPQNKAYLAVDKNLSTCSITERSWKPWWRVWLAQKYNIRNITILTGQSYIGYFESFEVMVENNTADRYENKYSDHDICYTHGNVALVSTNIDIACNKTLIGNQIKIRLAMDNVQLVLCDIRIYGECENGTFGVHCTEKCSIHCTDTCNKNYGTCASCKHGWTGSRCTQVCEDGKYGKNCIRDCSPFCRNNTACRKTDGICVSGCSPGYTREKCDTRCYYGKYGTDCKFNCSGNCRNNSVCSHVDGSCAEGCKAGYTGNTCYENCQNGAYGQNCSFNCDGHCANSSICRPSDGHCLSGCEQGWTGHSCHNICVDGFYGYDCLHKCSPNCVGGNSNCDHVHGSCTSGCIAGWNGRKCDKVCATGSWGLNCANSCGHCLSGVCRYTDGVCDGGCDAGFKQTPHCDEECDNGSYGINCSRICSKNCKDVCNKQSGACGYCRSGWYGANCTQECSSGWYGINCSKKCSPGCKDVGNCRKTDGICSECKPGMEGIMCEKASRQIETVTEVHLTGGEAVGILVSVVVLIFISVFVTVLIMRRKLQANRSHNTYGNETVSYSNVLAAELNRTEATEAAHDTLKRNSEVEHTYE